MELMANWLLGWPRTPYNWLDLAGCGLPIVWLTKPGVLQPRPRGMYVEGSITPALRKSYPSIQIAQLEKCSKQPTAKDELK